LIFNFVFAKILVGTQITRQDVYGTVVVMASVVWIVVFGGMNSSGDIEETMTLTDLKMLFARIVFIIYFSVLNGIIFAFLGLGMYAYWAISLDDESGQLRKNMKARLTQLLGTNRFARASGLTLEGDEGLAAEARDQRLKKVVAMIFSACGGLLASETLLLAKSGVKLITSTLAGDNQFTDYLSYFILFVLVFTAILQVCDGERESKRTLSDLLGLYQSYPWFKILPMVQNHKRSIWNSHKQHFLIFPLPTRCTVLTRD
jgi:hypothetical protein